MVMSDLVERLRRRTLVRHGGESKYGWNLTEGDSELHVEAATEIEALRTSLAHWKVFAEHAEGERSQLSADAARLDRFEEWLADRAGPLLHIDQIREALK